MVSVAQREGVFSPRRRFFNQTRCLQTVVCMRWPPFAKGSLSGSWTGFAALLAYGGYYRALAGGATIPGDRPVRPDFEKPYLPRLAAAGLMGAIFGGWTERLLRGRMS